METNDTIIATAANTTGTTIPQIMGKRRNMRNAEARMLIYIVMRCRGYSGSEIVPLINRSRIMQYYFDKKIYTYMNDKKFRRKLYAFKRALERHEISVPVERAGCLCRVGPTTPLRKRLAAEGAKIIQP